MWHFLLWLHRSLQGESRVTSSAGIIHRLGWLPWPRADGIDTGCKPVPINHGRRCKLHRGCFSVLTNSVFIWYQHGDRRVGSVSQVSFPDCECLALRDVSPKWGFSFRIPVERTPIGTFHFRSSWTAAGCFLCWLSWVSRKVLTGCVCSNGASQCVTVQETLLPLTVIHTF